MSALETALGVVFRYRAPMAKSSNLPIASGYDPARPNRLRELRLRAGLSLEKLAERCKPPTTKAQIKKLEQGPGPPGVKMDIVWMYRLAAALGCKPYDLLPEPPDNILPLAEREHLERYLKLPEPDRLAIDRVIDGLSAADRAAAPALRRAKGGR